MPWELIVQSPNTERIELDIKPGRTTIGRMSGHDIVISDEAASRNHSVMELGPDDRLVIWDAGSTNGTFVNGREISAPQELNHNDQVRIGLHLLTVLSKGQAGQEAAPVLLAARGGDFESLLIRSLDHYTVLLHNLSIRLSRVQSIVEAQRTICAFLAQMLNADKCGVVLEDDFESLAAELGSEELVQQVQEMKSPLLLQAGTDGVNMRSDISSLVITPVLIDQATAAVIYAAKEGADARPFEDLDRLLIVGVSHHAAMAIQRLRYEQALLHSANYDTLTGLPNRKLFLERLSRAIARARRHADYGFAVFFIDANNFKLINDSLGHQLGDEVLREIGARLQTNFRELDTVARFGGDEFAVLVDGARNIQEVLPLAQRLLASTAEPYHIKGHEFVILLSVGITLSTAGYEFAEDAMRDADIAMYKSKEAGGATFRVYDRAMHAQLMQSLKLQTELRNAYKMEEFLLQYQPVIALQTGEVRGFEALVRWRSREQGLLKPDQFLSSIDSTGLLRSLEGWVVRTACRQLADWNRQLAARPPFFISVNLSLKQLDAPTLLEDIRQVVSDSGIAVDQLWLEVSEKNGIDLEGGALERLQALRALGVRLCLDDFGTGYSALGYLSRMPLHVLKIDRSIIGDVHRSAESNKVIRTVISLAGSLGLSVVAEGVETQAQHSLLRLSRCEYAQGYFFSEPLDAERIPEFLERHRAAFAEPGR